MTEKKSGIINIISNYNRPSKETSKLLREKFEEKGFKVPEKYDNKAELNICVGGDGAFLRAVHRFKFPRIPFIGVNTGHLGFFQEIVPSEVDDFIDNYVNHRYSIEEIFLIKARIKTNNKTFTLHGVNEIVIRGIRSKVVHLKVFIQNNHLENFCGDGLIISTPVGSTGYNFSGGGSVVYPSLKTLQLTPLAPINSKAYRSLGNSAIIPGDINITIKPEYRYENSILLIVDGVEYKYNDIRRIDFSMPTRTISRLNFNEDMYWTNLKSKFL